MTPWHARQIIHDGDLAVVLSLETDKVLSSEGNNYGNWKQQLDTYRVLGVTTMQIVHESNNTFAGAALHRNDMEKLQLVHWPIASLENLIRGSNTFDLDAKGYNRLGLTAEGEELVDALVARRMPIDLAHSSWHSKNHILARVPRGYALYDSHTKFERPIDPKYHPVDYGDQVIRREQEFVLTEDMLPDYLAHQVLLGLRPASIDVYNAPQAKVPNNCPGSANSFAQQVQYATDKGFAIAKAFRTTRLVGEPDDLPARVKSFKKIAGRNYYTDGLAHIGMLPELTVDLIDNLKTPGAVKLTQGAEAYLTMWERAYSTQP